MPPKATKKKKAKEADFKKAKLKLGKGKKAANNATDTSFKARSIALPGQNPLNRALVSQAGSSTEPTTSQGLNLEDIFIRFRHPNAGVRRESLGGLKEILTSKPDREVGKVLKALGGLIADDDAAVRKALISFLGWYLSSVPTTLLEPHLSLLLLQTSSALSHIFPETRLDAAKLVNLLLEHIPSQLIGSWPSETSSAGALREGNGGSTILEGLRLALGLGEGGSTSRITAGGKLIILKAMLGFITAALHETGSSEGEGRAKLPERIFTGWDEDTPQPAKKPAAPSIEITGKSAWDSHQEGWVVGPGSWAMEISPNPVWEIGRIGSEVAMEQEDARVTCLVYLFDQLKSLLLNTFLEAAPSAFSISSSSPTPAEDVSLQLCRVSASLVELLARPILSSPTPNAGVQQGVSDFLKKMTAWFPFPSPPATSADISAGLSLSISYANLATLLSSNPTPLQFRSMLEGQAGWKERIEAAEAAWVKMRAVRAPTKGKGKARGVADEVALGSVAEWVVDLLAPNKDALQSPMSSHTYAALLPVIFALITQPPSPSGDSSDDVPTLVLVAVLRHVGRQSATSAIRSLGEEFLMRLIHIHEQRFPQLPFYITPASPVRPLVHVWLEGLPKTLWEIGTRDSEATERILRLLLWLGLRGEGSFEEPYSLGPHSAFALIAAKLAPYFHLAHPSKGDIFGPWIKLESEPIRKLTLDVARTWLEWDTSGALRGAVDKAVAGDPLWGKIWNASF